MFLRHLTGVLRVGLRQYLREVWYLREFRGGCLVGKDGYGNEYYEFVDPVKSDFTPDELPFYRKRYVMLKGGGSDEATEVPADWHGWLHYTNDDAPSPCAEGIYSYPSWGSPHTPNYTGSDKRYVPYSTTTFKVIPFAEDKISHKKAFAMGNSFINRQTNQLLS